MLLELHVKNFALIEDARISFTEGLNVLTGETGAGKSILIDALGSALGARCGNEVIGNAGESAFVELIFAVPEEMEALLGEMDIRPENGCVLLSRRILPNRSVFRINDELATAARVRAFTELLLDIHGQHEHQSLLKKSVHREILDSFGGEETLRLTKRVRTLYEEQQKAQRALSGFTMKEEDRLRELDFLEYEIAELESAGVSEKERESVAARFKEMSHFEKIRDALTEVLSAIAGDQGMEEQLEYAIRSLGSVRGYSEELSSYHDGFCQLEDELETLLSSVRSFAENAVFDPEEFRRLQDRLDEYHRLESKYGESALYSGAALEKRTSRREELLHYEERLQAAKASLAQALELLAADCRTLHAEREAAAPLLEEAVTAALTELSFLSVEFRAEIRELSTPGPDGADEVEFMVSLNPGQPLAPLIRVASGGELSRIMLAIKTVLADKDRIPTLIFDEIDSGISGRTAQAVGKKLAQIARYRQVILITHLAQIAAFATRHIGIEKEAQDAHTRTKVRVLSEEEALGEIARLMGGGLSTDALRDAAIELKKSSRQESL